MNFNVKSPPEKKIRLCVRENTVARIEEKRSRQGMRRENSGATILHTHKKRDRAILTVEDELLQGRATAVLERPAFHALKTCPGPPGAMGSTRVKRRVHINRSSSDLLNPNKILV